MKNLYVLLLAVCFAVTACSNTEEMECKVCGIDNPLQDIEWLREYCENLKERQDISKVSIDLYKVIDTGKHLFKIGTIYSNVDTPLAYSEYWRDCTGNNVFYWMGDLVHADPGKYYEFIEDKEFVAELFHFIKQ